MDAITRVTHLVQRNLVAVGNSIKNAVVDVAVDQDAKIRYDIINLNLKIE